jgi:deoxyribodipyrimidine photo-lyase
MSEQAAPVIVWFRQDLRLHDNPALAAAAERGPVVPVYILDDESAGSWRMGGASRRWLHHSLAALGRDLGRHGAPLVLRRGDAGPALARLIAETGARAVYWNRCYEPRVIARDQTIKHALKERGLEARSFNAALLAEPWTVKTREGNPFRVFTPFWRALREQASPAAPLPAPARLTAGPSVASEALDVWRLLPRTPDWAAGLRAAWAPGEAGARRRLALFLDEALAGYGDGRDRPGRDGTSRLSPHLHFGEIGPRQVWQAIMHRMDAQPACASGAESYLRELGWREFSYHLLHQFPELPEAPLRAAFARFPWREAPEDLARWQRGLTGFPIVDAGMRELWATGWMHNRVRMIVASFLVKDLLIPWQQGAAWFWDTLVDADLANNAASWQWVAGCGADAAPYFRVFNPALQGAKFDPDGDYVRRWCPELAHLPNAWIHRPAEAPADILSAAGVLPGRDYPAPMIDHKRARERALACYKELGADAA